MPGQGRSAKGPAKLFVAATMLVAAATSAPAEKPPVTPGEPVAGPAVVVLTTGVDYTKPSVARKLARDGEGDLVGWDAVDRDRRPYGTDPAQSRLVEIAPLRVIPVRVDLDDPASVAEASDFVRRTASRVVVVPLLLQEGPRPVDLSALLDAKDVLIILAGQTNARRYELAPEVRERVIIVGALAATGAVAKDAVDLDVILLPPAAAREAPGDGARAPRNAAEAAILFVAQLACRRSELAAANNPRDAKRILLSHSRKEPAGGPPVLEDCTRSLGPR